MLTYLTLTEDRAFVVVWKAVPAPENESSAHTRSSGDPRLDRPGTLTELLSVRIVPYKGNSKPELYVYNYPQTPMVVTGQAGHLGRW